MDVFALELEKLWNKYGEEFNDFFHSLGYGNTRLEELPPEINPYDNIYIKREDLNPKGNIKTRAIAGTYFLEEKKGNIEGKTMITLTSSGNFAKTMPDFLNSVGSNLKIRYFILKDLLYDNPDLVTKLDGDVIPVPESGYCSISGRDKGRAITNALIEAELNEGFIYFDQHDGIGNSFGNLTLGQENARDIRKITNNISNAMLVQGIGTGGSALGNYYGFLLHSETDPEFVGLLPEDGKQIGLRNLNGQGDSGNFSEIKRISSEILTISNKESFETAELLWGLELPAGITTGTNVSGALKLAERFQDKTIITLMPDSIKEDNYRTFLENNYKDITSKPFDENLYNSLQ